jgi:hypothetical protein
MAWAVEIFPWERQRKKMTKEGKASMADFSYYYGSDAEQFNFFRLPKRLVRDKRFDKLTSEAKILYGVLLDRMTLSAQNGWVDDENRVYIIYTTREVMQEFNCSERKAISLMGELDTNKGIGLIEKKRQGLGRPNIIYVKNFNSVAQSDGEHVEEENPKFGHVERKNEPNKGSGERTRTRQSSGNRVPDGGGVEEDDQAGTWRDFEEIKERLPVATTGDEPREDLVKKEAAGAEGKPCGFQTCTNVQVKTCKNVQVKTCKNVQVKTCKSVQVKNETDRNETDIKQYISIHPSNQEAVQVDGRMDRNLVMDEFKSRLEYDILVCDLPGDKCLVDNLFQVLVDAYCQESKSQGIGGGKVPTADIRQRLERLTMGHVKYVLGALKENTTKVRNVRSYVLTSLYNAPATMGLYYQNAVAHDMAAGAWKGGG